MIERTKPNPQVDQFPRAGEIYKENRKRALLATVQRLWQERAILVEEEMGKELFAEISQIIEEAVANPSASVWGISGLYLGVRMPTQDDPRKFYVSIPAEDLSTYTLGMFYNDQGIDIDDNRVPGVKCEVHIPLFNNPCLVRAEIRRERELEGLEINQTIAISQSERKHK